MNVNPYQSPSEFGSESSPFGSADGLQPKMLNHVRIVSILMIIQGVLCVLFGGMMLIAALVIVPIMQEDIKRQIAKQPQGAPALPAEQMQAILYITYGVMGAAGMIPGAIQIFAGARNYGFKGWGLGVFALIAGLASAGTCYCLPTGLGLSIYGLIIYFNPSVKRGFELVSQGWTPEQLISRAYQQQPLPPPKPNL